MNKRRKQIICNAICGHTKRAEQKTIHLLDHNIYCIHRLTDLHNLAYERHRNSYHRNNAGNHRCTNN